MALKYILGDLIQNAEDFDVVGHGCNCFQSFGAGIAKTVSDIYPEAFLADLKTAYGNAAKLGTMSTAISKSGKVTIANLYTQFKYTRTDVDVNYEALRSCMTELKKAFSGKKIGLPLIGAGLAGGDWNTISEIIKEELREEDVTIVIYEKDNKLAKLFEHLIMTT